mgnify:CR=1 FL=1
MRAWTVGAGTGALAAGLKGGLGSAADERSIGAAVDVEWVQEDMRTFVRPGAFDLYWIAVVPGRQGAGLGRQLIVEAERRSATQGATAMFIDTAGRDQYHPTRAFYERCGYELDASLEGFYGPGDGKAIFLAQKCNLCHSVSSAGIEATTKSEKVKGPDIKGLADRHDRGWVEKWLRQEIEVNGKKHSKAFKGSDEDFATLVDWLMAQ